MVLERLGEGLRNITKKISGVIFFDKNTIEGIVRELQKILLESDVDIKLAYELGEKIKRLAGNEKIKGIERKEQLIKLIHDEVVSLVGGEKHELIIDKKIKPYQIMMLGLYASGKTTTTSKLAFYYKKRGFKVCMIGLDVHRPAAPEQLEQLGKKIDVATFINKNEKNPIKIYKEFENKIKEYDLCLVDTAGRDALDKELIEEIKDIKSAIKPNEVLLVLPADIGQAAKKQTSEFQKACSVSGVIITRMDGTGKAGGALVACKETNSKVYFIGTGEHVSDLELFNPKNFVSRLLGMGDIEALVEKVQAAAEPGNKSKKRLEEGKFTLLDMYEQIKSMQNIGPMNKLTELIPGMEALKEKLSGDLLDKQGDKIKRWKNAMDSMTLEEIENPEILEKETGRISRISKGSGVKGSEIRELLSQHKLLKSFVASSKNPEANMEDIMKGKIPAGMSRKQLMKLAKKYRGKMF
jgi:signal recognition particle subunit SRP54